MPLPRHGFSFAEVIVAIMILSIGLLPIFWFFSRTNMGTIKTRDEIMAWQYAAELIDYAKARGYAGNDLTDDQGVEIRTITVGDVVSEIEDRFSRRLIVKALSPDHNSEWPCLYRTLTAEISWMAETRLRSLRLTGLVYAPE